MTLYVYSVEIGKTWFMQTTQAQLQTELEDFKLPAEYDSVQLQFTDEQQANLQSSTAEVNPSF